MLMDAQKVKSRKFWSLVTELFNVNLFTNPGKKTKGKTYKIEAAILAR